jgi:hypothetical protein
MLSTQGERSNRSANCLLPFLQQSLREQREHVLMTRSGYPVLKTDSRPGRYSGLGLQSMERLFN